MLYLVIPLNGSQTAQVWSSEWLLLLSIFKALLQATPIGYSVYPLPHTLSAPLTYYYKSDMHCSELTLHIEWGFVCCDEMFHSAFPFQLGVADCLLGTRF